MLAKFSTQRISGLLILAIGLIILSVYFSEYRFLSAVAISYCLFGTWIINETLTKSLPFKISEYFIPATIIAVSLFELPAVFTKSNFQHSSTDNPVILVSFILMAMAIIGSKKFQKFKLYQILVATSMYLNLLYFWGYLSHENIHGSYGRNLSITCLSSLPSILIGSILLYSSRNDGFLKPIFANTITGKIVRKYSIFIVCIPFVVGILKLAGMKLGLFEIEIGIAFIVVTIALLLAIQLIYSTFYNSKLEASLNEIQLNLIHKSKELEHSEFLLKEASKLANIGSWEILLPEMVFKWTPEAISILEFDEALSEYHAVSEHIHPDHKERILGLFNDALNHRKPFEEEFLIFTGKGVEKWIRVKGIPVYNETGDFVGLRGVFQDIDGSKHKELALQESLDQIIQAKQEVRQKDELYRTLIEQGSDILALLDQNSFIPIPVRITVEYWGMKQKSFSVNWLSTCCIRMTCKMSLSIFSY